MSAESYEAEVKIRIERAISDGHRTFLDVLTRTDGADPRLVRRLFDDVIGRDDASSIDASHELSSIRSRVLEHMPASDPALGQWWYTPETQEQLVRRILGAIRFKKATKVLCLGTPTLAPLFEKSRCQVCVVDNDPDVISNLKAVCKSAKIVECDLLLETPEIETAQIAVVDPPWYEKEMIRFLSIAVQKTEIGGFIFVSLPPMLTRPTVHNERQELLKFLSDKGIEVLFLDQNVLRYTVPRFEEAAFSNLNGFIGKPWRVADLLICKRHKSIKIEEPISTPNFGQALTIQRFARNPKEFRVFVGKTSRGASRTIITDADGYAENVSRRAFNEHPDVWTSEKNGAFIENREETLEVLGNWQKGLDREETAKNIAVSRNIELPTAEEIVKKHDQVLGIWSRFYPATIKRDLTEINRVRATVTTQWATANSNREHGGNSDGYRSEFARDRDRILWSGSFRKLSGKTQLFPIEQGDQLRQRLAHSIEVMQLSVTIAESFGLDRDLVEAGALAHDIGHTPFGHAGEHAIDMLMVDVCPSRNSPGFNHYEHGVDVVRYLEGPYQITQGNTHTGLNLTPEVSECIFKHTYCQGGNRISHDEIRKRSKHKNHLVDGYCHLEGQAVRIADKISYLVSDIEDGIRLGAIDEQVLMSCKLFHRAPIDMSQPRGETLLHRFLLQRRRLIRVLMEDVIQESGRRIAKLNSPLSIRSQREYLISHSPVLDREVGEVWNRLQAQRLHTDPRVVRANMRAAKILSELLLIVAVVPEIVPREFRREHERVWSKDYMSFYRASMGSNLEIRRALIDFVPLDRYIGFARQLDTRVLVKIEEFILAKDFVASLTDVQAELLHQEFLR